MIQARFWLKLSINLFLSLILFLPAVHADSLWDNAVEPLYGTQQRVIKVGHMITVYISESTSASQQANTRTEKDSEISADFLSNFDQVSNILGNERLRQDRQFELGGQDSYRGSGQTSRRSQVNAVITAEVTEIFDNGNLFILGEHKVKVNNEIQTIRVSGVVRAQDISGANSIFSSQIAKAEVSINGAGVVATKQTPGMLTKMFNWLF